MPDALVKISSLTLSADSGSVSLTGIPAGYRDLRLVVQAIDTGAGTSHEPFIRLNGDAGSNYSRSKLFGNGSSVGTLIDYAANRASFDVWSASSNYQLVIDFFDYSQTNKNKTFLMKGGVAGNNLMATSASWASLAAINSITLYCTDQLGSGTPDNFAAGSTFTLYGMVG